jgi:hypothetical protein
VKYRVLMSVVIDARTDREAYECATKLKELLKSPMVKMAAEGAGVTISGDGKPIVHEPQYEF